MREERKINRTLIIGAVVTVVVTVGLVAGVMALGNKEEDESAAPSEATPPASSENPTGDSSENVPGALVGNTQRTWPDPAGQIDDTQHANPGTYSADWMKQQPVWTPRNHDGDLPKRESLKKSAGKCDKDGVALEGKTQQQYVNARYLVVNDQAGPSRLDRGVPRGYAHSPQGAVVAAINLFGYGMYAQGDGIGEEIDKQLWSTSKEAQEEREFRGLDSSSEERQRESRAMLMPGMDKYQVKTCSSDLVVVEVAFTQPEEMQNAPDAEGDIVSRVPMFWRDGDWQPDFSGSADKLMHVETADLNTFRKVEYQ